jgi:hypothetical protein
MNIGKSLAISAVTGILMGAVGCGGGDANTAPKTPSADMAAPAAKDCCKGTSGCKTESNATCAGHNDCKGKGTACPKPTT